MSSTNPADSTDLHLEGDAAPELLDGRIWVDGCFDFFHHGKHPVRFSTWANSNSPF